MDSRPKTQGGEGFCVGNDKIQSASILEYKLPRHPPSTNQDKSDLTLDSWVSASGGSTLRKSWFVESSNSSWFSGTEDTLSMHYLDQVFYNQYLFYNSSKGGRSRLLSILSRFRSACYTILALSDYHSRSSQLDSITGPSRCDLATQEMQFIVVQANTCSGSTVFIHSMENPTWVYQFLY